jgi:hypothetical protein
MLQSGQRSSVVGAATLKERCSVATAHRLWWTPRGAVDVDGLSGGKFAARSRRYRVEQRHRLIDALEEISDPTVEVGITERGEQPRRR